MKGQSKYMPLAAVVEGQRAMIAQCETNMASIHLAQSALHAEREALVQQIAALERKQCELTVEHCRVQDLRDTLRDQLENYDA